MYPAACHGRGIFLMKMPAKIDTAPSVTLLLLYCLL